jgi:hydroxysqualene dehydroxylase
VGGGARARGADPVTPTVAVIGGGLAGIAAAVRLADTGASVTLLEARRELGGATYSFDRAGYRIDTGQHVFLRCYDAYRELLRRLGSDGQTEIQDRFTVPVLAPGHAPCRLVRWRLPAPAHLLPALAGYRLLTPAERAGAIRAAAALRAVDPDAPGADADSFGDWLTRHGQGPRPVRRLWDLITVAALNTPARTASLALAARVFRTGLLDSAAAGDIGRPLVPLADLHGTPARRLLGRLGVRVLPRTRARWIRPEGAGFRIGAGGGDIGADTVVLAVPHPAAAQLVPPAAAPAAADWHRLGSSPIVNVHLRYQAAVTGLPFAAAVDSPAQWIFDRSVPMMRGEQHLVVSLSAADQALHRPSAELVGEQRAALAALFPAARRVPVRDGFVTREPHATFRQAPGTRRYRPAAATALPGLALAGAWTDTGWPDTMEGAVRSGHTAADVIIRHLVIRPWYAEAAP